MNWVNYTKQFKHHIDGSNQQSYEHNRLRKSLLTIFGYLSLRTLYKRSLMCVGNLPVNCYMVRSKKKLPYFQIANIYFAVHPKKTKMRKYETLVSLECNNCLFGRTARWIVAGNSNYNTEWTS